MVIRGVAYHHAALKTAVGYLRVVHGGDVLERFLWSLIFLRDQDKQPIQLFLRRILVLLDFRDVENSTILEIMQNISSRTVKGAAVIITITPILCVYPFLQKYFTKGMILGAVKA